MFYREAGGILHYMYISEGFHCRMLTSVVNKTSQHGQVPSFLAESNPVTSGQYYPPSLTAYTVL